MLAVLVFYTGVVHADTGEESLWLTAIDKYEKGRYQTAAIDFQGIIQSRHSRFESAARLMLARCYLEGGDLDAAEMEAKKLMRKFPFGRYMTHGRYLLAEVDFERKNHAQCARRLITVAHSGEDNDLRLLAREKLAGIFEFHLDSAEREEILTLVSDIRIIEELKTIQTGYLPRVKVGIILDLSGRDAEAGRNVLSGITAARDAVEKKHGHSLELKVWDTGGRVSESIKAAKSLIHEEDAVVILGGLDGACAAAIAGIAGENYVPFVVLGPQDVDLTEIGDRIYQLLPGAWLEGSLSAYVAINDFETRYAAILSPASEGGRLRVDGFKSKYEELGGQVDSVQWYYRGATNYKRQLDALVELGARRLGEEFQLTEEEILRFIAWEEEEEEELKEEALFNLFELEMEAEVDTSALDSLMEVYVSPINYFGVLYLPIQGEEIDYLAPQIAASGFDGYMIGDVNCLDHIRLESDWRYVNGMIFPANFLIPDQPGAGRDLGERSQKQAGKSLNHWRILGWDAFNFFAKSLDQAGRINSWKVNESLKGIRKFKGDRLTMTFPEGKMMNLSFYLLSFEDGWFNELKSPRQVAEILE
jgi:ABC-type branched-subunit amino acid transport system substrate-binding protein